MTVFLLFIFSGVLGAYMARHAPDVIQAKEADAGGDTILLSTRLITRYEYELCGHVITEESDMPREYIGLNKQELRALLDGVSIVKFSSEEVILEERYDCYCEQHVLAYLKDGSIEIYRCKHASDTFELIERIPIKESALSIESRQGLIRGKVFSGITEAEEYVKSFS